MLRRKLALYTLFYIAGISAGFFIFEKGRIIESAGFIAATAAAVIFTEPAVSLRQDTSNELRRSVTARQAVILFFIAGVVIFYIKSQIHDSALAGVEDVKYVRGTVVSVSVKKDRLNLTVKNSEKGPPKILVILDADSVCRSGTIREVAGPSDLRDAASAYTGTAIEARGEFEEFAPADNPGCFDYRLYMRSKGICAQFRAYIAEVTDRNTSTAVRALRYLYKTRESFIERFDDDTKGFIRGVIFGDKSEIDEDMLEEFNINSTGHILAVSGLHIGFLYGLLKLLTGRRRTLPASILIIAIILVYGEMTMWSPATVRACIVMSVSLFSIHLRRRSDLLTSISFAAMVLLTSEPYQLFSSGFQLSFLALCGIAFLTGPISHVTGEALAVMLAVQIGTLPVIAYSYCRINLLSVLINVPVILLASVLVPVCIVLLMSELLLGLVPNTGVRLTELISYAVIKLNHLLSFDGGFSVKTAGPGAAAIAGLYILAFGASSEWVRVMLLRKNFRSVLRQSVLLLIPVIMLSACFYDRISDDEIVFVSVGQGDCTHIRADGHDVLIDGGGQAGYGSKTGGIEGEGSDSRSGVDDGYNVGKKTLMPYLLHSGITKIDMALVTHLHTDHYKGICELADIFPVGAIGIPIDYRGSADMGSFVNSNSSYSESLARTARSDPEVFYIKPETIVNVADGVSVEVIWPVEISDEPLAADDSNEHNTVYMIRYKDIKVMVTGDLLEEDEHKMVEYYKDTDILKCDILKVAHHGSKSSSSEDFLDAAAPRIAVIEVGRNNFYGHPHQQTLDRLEKRGIHVFRTDISGAVGIDIRKDRLMVDLFR